MPHPQNEEFRLKRVFVDVGGPGRDHKGGITLGPHEYLLVAHQINRFGPQIEA